jgi:enterochelin esterase-like enzyme
VTILKGVHMQRWITISVCVMLIASSLISCASRSQTGTPTPSIVPIDTPTSTSTSTTNTSTSSPNRIEGMLNPGDSLGSMRLVASQGEYSTEIWSFCDPYITETGISSRECSLPSVESIFIGYGSLAGSTEELDAAWPSATWELYLDGLPVNLPAFGTFDQSQDVATILRSWDVLLENPLPGVHTLRYLSAEGDAIYDTTWTITVVSPSTMEIPASTESLPFSGISRAFNTLAEFDTLMQSALAAGEVDPFWEAVQATGQMPLIFGDTIAVFLYRGPANQVECRGDFITAYLRQGETDLWGFIKQVEPDARLEYKILLNSSTWITDPLNPTTETGGLGTNSVLRMPGYLIPEFTVPRDDIAHGTLGEEITISSHALGYAVNYRVYTPSGYGSLSDLPVIFVTDGQDFSNPGMGAMLNALDGLIAEDLITPVMAVFIDARDPQTGANRREVELVPSSLEACPFCDFIARELVPAIDVDYRTDSSPDARAILGFSLGGNFTAQMGLVYPDVFHLVAVQSPYISANWIFDTYQQADRLPLKIFLNHGTYDERAASIRLRLVLEAKGYPLLYIETHEGHSYGTVRGVLDDMLIYFFGPQ